MKELKKVNKKIENGILRKKTGFFYLYIAKLFNKWIYGYLLKENQLYLYVNAMYILKLMTGLKNNTITSMVSLLDIAIVDVPNRVLNRFEVNYIFLNYTFEYRIGVKVFTDGLFPLFSLSKLYKSSLWLEREAFDMYGIRFLFNYDLRRILNDYSFQGHPLRKDFPLVGYVEVFYNDSTGFIESSVIESSQKLRLFNFDNPWTKWS